VNALAGGPLVDWGNVLENQAFTVSFTGFTTVFLGLATLCLCMLGLARVARAFDRRAGGTAERGVEPSAGGPPPAPAPATPREAPAAGPARSAVPYSLLAAAVAALHLHAEGRMALGESARLVVGGTPRQATLLAVGWLNRVVVDGEDVAFLHTQVAAADVPRPLGC